MRPIKCLIRLLLAKGSFSNDEGDGNKNVIKAVGLLDTKTNLHVHHTFWHNSLPSLHDYDVKVPYFTFSGGRKQATTNFLCFSKLKYGPQETNSRTFAYIWHFQQFGINAKKTLKKREFILIVTFSLPSLSSMLKMMLHETIRNDDF